MTAISDKYRQLGGARGFLGSPLGRETAAPNGGRQQEFQNGSIYWHPQTGAWEIHGMIRDRWLALGGAGSFLGYPTTDETAARDGVGRFNDFERASIYWHPATGAHEIHGLIRQRWRDLGGELSPLGYPLTDETPCADGVGRYNHCQNGSLYWTPATGAHEVFGAIRERWAELRGERGLLGYPSAAPATEIRGRITYTIGYFQHGAVEVNMATQGVLVKKYSTQAAPNYLVPLVVFRVADDDGSRPCAIAVDGAQHWVDEANRVFAAAGVRFVWDGVLRELRDTEVNKLTGEGDPWWPAAAARLNRIAAQERSVVVVHRFGPGSTSIGGGFSWWTYDFVAMSFFDPNALGVLPHELGHHFGLPHTHGRDFQNERQATDYILNGQSVDELDGDRSLIDDTPPDPYIVSLSQATAVNAVTLAGRPFALARQNIMSYWNHGGSGRLSASQIERVRHLVVERSRRYLAVTVVPPIDCPTLLGQLAGLQRRLADLVAERDAAVAPADRRRLSLAVTRLRSQVRRVQGRAALGGCS